ncbi:hypothetical protein [Streptomyces pristinaespiralis]|jgi:hypothetical protein|uniref:hypothetical protein n=1 Tax=Streptomyces pristinaespiralis TaxID=38300 RepID=UPI0033E0BE8C
MESKVTVALVDCQPNARFGGNVSPFPVTENGERFVQREAGTHAAATLLANVIRPEVIGL